MKSLILILLVMFGVISTAIAQNKVVVVPLNSGQLKCTGTMNGSRWCDNGDGTVMDMTTSLVWLKNAGCFGLLPWTETTTWNDAQAATGKLANGSCNLTDGTTNGDWRLPTKNELYEVANGDEQVRYTTPRAFSGLVNGSYCTSSTTFYMDGAVWLIQLANGGINSILKTNNCYVWPVRKKM